MAEGYATFDPLSRRLAEAFWPGPLTLVLPKTAKCPVHDLASAGLPTLAIRVPAHPVAQALILSAGVPIAAPSAEVLRPAPQPMYSDWDELMAFPDTQRRSLAAAPVPEPEIDSAPAEPVVTAELVPMGDAPAENLPAPATSQPAGGLTLPQLPDLTKVAARLLRPLMAPVAPVVDRVIDTSVQQLRSAQKVIEEFEEITFTLRRTSRTTVSDSEQEQSSGVPQHPGLAQGPGPRVEPQWAAPQMNATFAPTAPLRGTDHHTALSGAETTIIDAADERRALKEGRRAIEP